MQMIAHMAAVFAGYKHGRRDEIKSESTAGWDVPRGSTPSAYAGSQNVLIYLIVIFTRGRNKNSY